MIPLRKIVEIQSSFPTPVHFPQTQLNLTLNCNWCVLRSELPNYVHVGFVRGNRHVGASAAARQVAQTNARSEIVLKQSGKCFGRGGIASVSLRRETDLARKGQVTCIEARMCMKFLGYLIFHLSARCDSASFAFP